MQIYNVLPAMNLFSGSVVRKWEVRPVSVTTPLTLLAPLITANPDQWSLLTKQTKLIKLTVLFNLTENDTDSLQTRSWTRARLSLRMSLQADKAKFT